MSLFEERYIKINIYLLKIGLWPTKRVQIRTIVLLIIQVTFCLSAIVKSYMGFDKRTASDAFSHCNGAIIVIAYYCILIKDKEIFSKLMCELNSGVLGDMNEVEKKFMRHAGLELRRISKIVFCIYVGAISVIFVQPFTLLVYNMLFTSNGRKFFVLPPPMALPIIYNCIITYIMESIATTITLSSLIGCTILFMVLTLYLCAQFKALREMLAQDQYPGKWTKWGVNSNWKLNRCIERHIKLIELSKILAKIYGPILWIDCLLSTINICFVMFSLAAQPTAEHFFSEFLYLCAGVSQLFIANWISDRLLNASTDVGLGAYSSRWPELDLNYRRKVLFIIQRSQKPMTLQYFAKFTPSLEVFVNICTSAWGYFNILRSVVHST